MGRPRLSKEESKVKVNFTFSPEQKEMLAFLAEQNQLSASQLLGKWIERNYKTFQTKHTKKSKEAE